MGSWGCGVGALSPSEGASHLLLVSCDLSSSRQSLPFGAISAAYFLYTRHTWSGESKGISLSPKGKPTLEVEPERDPYGSFPLCSFGPGDGHTSSKLQRVRRRLAPLPHPELPPSGLGDLGGLC